MSEITDEPEAGGHLTRLSTLLIQILENEHGSPDSANNLDQIVGVFESSMIVVANRANPSAIIPVEESRIDVLKDLKKSVDRLLLMRLIWR